MTAPRLSHVLIFCKDLPKLARFYAQAFDLTPQQSNDPGFLFLKSPVGAGIALHALPKEIADAVDITDPPYVREETCLKVCFEVNDLDTARDGLLRAGGHAKVPWRWETTRFCECADPEGNVIQLFQSAP